MSLEQISEIVRRRRATGEYGSARFLMTPADWRQVRTMPQPPPWQYEAGISALLSIPIVEDAGLPAGEWRLVDASGEVLFVGHLDS